ncbi:glycoside hydrolase family 16 protein [Colwellia piezophila]|uniref:glycoside hydrolase family 16 protein n=1 Tax=Colwellia piezophila TaxID=211668 RepID=UPI00037A83E7|nr:glycoside hydrolase family 16 protein [Colwellia piezophila]
MKKINIFKNIAVGLIIVIMSTITLFFIAQAKESNHPASNNKSWQLVWSDEFDGHDIDGNKWSHVVDCYGGGNNEQQCYTDRQQNSFVKDGLLNIIAQREDFVGSANADGSMSRTTTLPYTSSKLRTMNKGDWLYGRFEIRAKLPYGQGTWPAIWMLPTDYVYGGWAASGEIDIVEAANLKTPSGAVDAIKNELESRIHGTLHFGEAWPNNVHSGTAYKFAATMNPADSFHTYAIEWQEGEIRWYVDDIHYATQRKSGWYSKYLLNDELVVGEGSAPYDQKFHLILNLAVGGAWASGANNKGIDEAAYPQKLQIDYVRVYQCNLSVNTGAGCETIGENAELVKGHKIITPDKTLALGANFDLYQSALNEVLVFNLYDPGNSISYHEVTTENGRALSIKQQGDNGNIALQYPAHADLSHLFEKGQLVFDVKIKSRETNSKLLVKLGSGWPMVSDVELPHHKIGQWQQVRLNIAELINSGNSKHTDPLMKAVINNIHSLFVVEPKGPMELLLKNIRFENRP